VRRVVIIPQDDDITTIPTLVTQPQGQWSSAGTAQTGRSAGRRTANSSPAIKAHRPYSPPDDQSHVRPHQPAHPSVRRHDRLLRAGPRPLGIKMLMAFEGAQGLGAMRRCCRLTAPSEPSSSIHLALSTPDKSAIRAFHPAALRAGGKTMTPRARATSPRAITPPSSSIPTATTSKRSAAAPEPDAPAGRCGVAQGQASAISVFAPSSAASSIGAKPCGRSGGVEAMVTRP
jgi:hypothetical protein